MNECGAYGQDFNSVRLFDRHRVGKHAYTFKEGMAMVPPREDGRRCLDPVEMRADGWALNERGRWSDPVEAARGVSALHRSAGARSRADASR